MKLSHDQQRDLAFRILKAYHIHASVSNAFRKGTKNHRLFYSERASKTFPAILYFVDNNPEWADIIKDYEAETGNLVFHATLTHTEFGDLLDLLSIPSEAEDIQPFLEDLSHGLIYSHCVNLTDPMCSESGMIQIRPAMGGIERIA